MSTRIHGFMQSASQPGLQCSWKKERKKESDDSGESPANLRPINHHDSWFFPIWGLGAQKWFHLVPKMLGPESRPLCWWCGHLWPQVSQKWPQTQYFTKPWNRKHGGVHSHGGTPKWMVYVMENPTKMDDLRVLYPIVGPPHMKKKHRRFPAGRIPS